MQSTNRKRVLFVSSAVILLCMTIVVGMSWALFTDTETLNHHLKAGTLDIELWRTNLVTNELDPATGYLVEGGTDVDKEFSNTNENVFELTDSTLIVPGSKYTADMELRNSSDVAYRYWVEVVFKGNDTVFADPAAVADYLENQVKVTVTTAENNDPETTPYKKWAADGVVVGSESYPIGILPKTAVGTFTVDIEFIDDRIDNSIINNSVMDQSFNFDIVVHAVQEKTAPTTNP